MVEHCESPHLFFSSRAFEWVEHTMSVVGQFWIFDLTRYRGCWPFGGRGGDQNSKASRHIWSTCFWNDRSPSICLPACKAKKCSFGTPYCVWRLVFVTLSVTSEFKVKWIQATWSKNLTTVRITSPIFFVQKLLTENNMAIWGRWPGLRGQRLT